MYCQNIAFNMKQYFAISFVIVLLVCGQETLSGQNNPIRVGGKIRLELGQLPVDESSLRAKLMERGVDLDSLNERMLAQHMTTIESILVELLGKVDKKIITSMPIVNDTVTSHSKVYRGAHVAVGAHSTVVAETPKSRVDTLYIKEEPIDYSCNGIGIYGQHIFKDKTLELYQVSDDVKAPEHYILGVGDEVTVTIFGISQADLKYIINSEGYISPEGMPRIFLKGLPFSAAKPLLQQRFSQSYNFLSEQFTVRITSVRNITVNIFGDVVKNGSYVIPAINTAFNAIVAAEGPTDIGGVRAIKVIQNGQEKLLDVYEFLQDPAVAFEYQIEENAVIFVPTAKKVVTIRGAVKRPCTYELIEGEDLFDLIDYAGGLTDDANTDRIQIYRYENNNRVLEDVNLKELVQQNKGFDLLKGDTVMVYAIQRPLENYVHLSGEVKYPGRFALKKQMTISDLLYNGELLPTSKTDVAYLIRTNLDQTKNIIRVDLENVINNPKSPTDLQLTPKDELVVFAQSEFSEKTIVSISGAVRNPTELPYDVDQSITVQDLILLADGLKPNAAQYGYIKRKDPTNTNIVDYIQVDLFAAMADLNDPENLVLKPNDQLKVYTTERYSELHYFEIEGAVREPGKFDFDRDMKLRELIYLAGGTLETAEDNGYILRSDIENPKQKKYLKFSLSTVLSDSSKNIALYPRDYIFIPDKQSYVDNYPIKVLGAVRNPGEYVLGDSLTLRSVIDLAGGLKYQAAANHIDLYRMETQGEEETRRFVTSFAIDSSFQIIDSTLLDTTIVDSLGQFHFKPFDHIIVREVPGYGAQELVKVEGFVQYPGHYVLTKENQTLADLIEEAGGLRNGAFPKGATLYRVYRNTGFVVIRLDKALKSKNSSYNLVLKEGDLIKVPSKEDLVYIRASGTIAGETYPEKFIDSGLITVAFQGTKSSKWYIENFAAGLSKDAKKRKLIVERPNNHLLGTKKFFFFNQYPKVTVGSTIGVGLKERRRRALGNGGKEPVDWENVLAKSLTTLTSVFGLIVLVNQVSN